MKCPVDGAELRMTERQGVEIDYCPSCRGIWLDRGELDKIIDRSAEETATPAPRQQVSRPAAPREAAYHETQRYDPRHETQYGGYHHDPRYYKKKKKKRKSILEEIFDF